MWTVKSLTGLSPTTAQSQDSPYRKEQKRADLTGTNMHFI